MFSGREACKRLPRPLPRKLTPPCEPETAACAPQEAAGGNISFCRYLTTAGPQATTAAEAQYVVQYVRPSVPRHDLRREPRAGDRLRGRRLPARPDARRR